MVVKFILISYGRSGTAFIMSTIKSIFDSKSENHYEEELFGSNEIPMEINKNNVIKMVDDYFDKKIKDYPNSFIYGFKWKPYYLDDNYYKLFPVLKKDNIKIIVSNRNPLHIFISRQKHLNNNIQSHYGKYDTKRIQEVRSIRTYLPIDELIYFIKEYLNTMEMYNNILNKYNIPNINVDYEELSDKNINSWIKIIHFLNNNSQNQQNNDDEETKLLIKNLKYNLDNPKYIKTTIMKDWEIIINYDEVLESLKKNNLSKYIQERK